MRKEKNAKRKAVRRVLLLALAAIVLISAVIVGMCLLHQRPAVHTPEEYSERFPHAVISVSDDGSVEIKPGEGIEERKTGIIFYVGAQITPDAYIPLMARLSEQGYYCSIPKLTCNMASLSPNAAEQIMKDHPEIGSWYLAGHSMGGLTASGFADDHREEIDGLILIAAYTNRDMKNADVPVFAVFGDADGVMNKTLYDKRLDWNPEEFEEQIIPGANHAQYGDYGKQPRDTDAAISADDQQRQTADRILDWLSRHETAKGN